MPALCAFDIDTSGAAHSVLYTDPMRQNCYRWSHWDLGDEDLLPWAMNTLPIAGRHDGIGGADLETVRSLVVEMYIRWPAPF
jgi:hypothetical protein